MYKERKNILERGIVCVKVLRREGFGGIEGLKKGCSGREVVILRMLLGWVGVRFYL